MTKDDFIVCTIVVLMIVFFIIRFIHSNYFCYESKLIKILKEQKISITIVRIENISFEGVVYHYRLFKGNKYLCNYNYTFFYPKMSSAEFNDWKYPPAIPSQLLEIMKVKTPSEKLKRIFFEKMVLPKIKAFENDKHYIT